LLGKLSLASLISYPTLPLRAEDGCPLAISHPGLHPIFLLQIVGDLSMRLHAVAGRKFESRGISIKKHMALKFSDNVERA